MADEALRRADELLSELIELTETARAVPMSASCVLPRERVLDLLDELREVLPPEMDEARTVIATRDRVLKDAYEEAAATRARAVEEADTVLDDARHRAEQIGSDADQRADEVLQAAAQEHARLVSTTAVHQAAAAAATALREDAERYQAHVTAEAQAYDTQVRAEADRYAHDARAEAERYATKLTADADEYADRTLDELAGVLSKAASTAEQGRAALRQRRAGAWTADGEDWSSISA
jgi:cell division septum initiation protein DivIVA